MTTVHETSNMSRAVLVTAFLLAQLPDGAALNRVLELPSSKLIYFNPQCSLTDFSVCGFPELPQEQTASSAVLCHQLIPACQQCGLMLPPQHVCNLLFWFKTGQKIIPSPKPLQDLGHYKPSETVNIQHWTCSVAGRSSGPLQQGVPTLQQHCAVFPE